MGRHKRLLCRQSRRGPEGCLFFCLTFIFNENFRNIDTSQSFVSQSVRQLKVRGSVKREEGRRENEKKNDKERKEKRKETKKKEEDKTNKQTKIKR